jgi:hypothetical protein
MLLADFTSHSSKQKIRLYTFLVTLKKGIVVSHNANLQSSYKHSTVIGQPTNRFNKTTTLNQNISY